MFSLPKILIGSVVDKSIMDPCNHSHIVLHRKFISGERYVLFYQFRLTQCLVIKPNIEMGIAMSLAGDSRTGVYWASREEYFFGTSDARE